MKIDRIHHVAYRCRDAKETVLWYGQMLKMDFVPIEGVPQHPVGAGLVEIDHLTHNVYEGRMDVWAKFYEKLFNFREIRYFDIKGKKTGPSIVSLKICSSSRFSPPVVSPSSRMPRACSSGTGWPWPGRRSSSIS